VDIFYILIIKPIIKIDVKFHPDTFNNSKFFFDQ